MAACGAESFGAGDVLTQGVLGPQIVMVLALEVGAGLQNLTQAIGRRTAHTRPQPLEP